MCTYNTNGIRCEVFFFKNCKYLPIAFNIVGTLLSAWQTYVGIIENYVPTYIQCNSSQTGNEIERKQKKCIYSA